MTSEAAVTLSHHELGVKSYLQALGGMRTSMEKGRQYFVANGIDPDDVVKASLFPDMKPFNFQVQTAVCHAVDGCKALASGLFVPSLEVPDRRYGELQDLVADALDTLEQVTPDDVNRHARETVLFKAGDFAMSFTTQNFLISFSLPNVHFHSSIAYGLLRMRGVPVGKLDYIGQLRIEPG